MCKIKFGVSLKGVENFEEAFEKAGLNYTVTHKPM